MPAVVLALLVAQAATAAGAADPTDPSSLARIRKGLTAEAAPVAATTVEQSGDHPVFRLTVKGFRFKDPIWLNHGIVPGYVRPSMPIYHYEFLEQVTPQEFRASVLYPGAPTTPFGGVLISVPLMPLAELAAKEVNGIVRRIQEARAREEVQKALRDLQARTAAGKQD
jgi:hypothetical protein